MNNWMHHTVLRQFDNFSTKVEVEDEKILKELIKGLKEIEKVNCKPSANSVC